MVLESNTYIDISPYHEILSGMNFILSISVGVVKLTGPAGTGKTRLLQQLQTELESERQETLLFLTPPTSIKDLHDTITRKLKLDNEFGFNKALIHHIIAKPYDQQRLVVMFDNAELIDIDVLLAIALFRNVMHNSQPIVSIVLCGGEALNTKLDDTSYRPLVSDMLLSYEIHPLTREQLQAYGNACADIHRLGKLPLKNGVLTELLAESKGLPGPVPDLLKKLKEKVASDAVAAKADEPPAPIAAAIVAKPVEVPAARAAEKPAFRLFGRAAKNEAAELAPAATPAKAARPAFRLFGKAEPKVEAPPAVAAVPAPKPVRAEPAPLPAPAHIARPAPSSSPAPVPAAASVAVPEQRLATPESVAAPIPEPVAARAAAIPVPADTDTPALSADERLILASRAEKEAARRKKFNVDIDWVRWKPAIQRSALAAGLLVAVVIAWPRVAPLAGDLYASLTGSRAPAAPPAEPVAPPAEVAVTDEPAQDTALEAPPAAEEAPPVVAETPPAAEQAPRVAEAPPVADEPAQAPVTEPAPQVATNAPAPAAEPQPQAATNTPATTAVPAPQVATATPAAARPAARVAGPAATDANPAELENLIRDWLMAWQDQNVDNFFSYYHTDFAPLYQNTVADWRAERQNRISRPSSIMIELEDFMIEETSRIGTRVSFWMNYESPNYADRTLKEVLIGPDVDGQWRILQEYNQQTEALGAAAVASTPTSTPATRAQRTQVAPATALSNATGPVQPPQVATRATFTQDQIDGIARFLAEWLTAWQNQDVDDYFRHYEPGYKPESMASTDAWRNDRIAKINRPQRIVLRMDQLEILAGDADNVRVQLVLEYHSTHYADRTVKEIELRKSNAGDWLIAQEKNREVVPMPLMRLLPVDSLAFLVMN